MTDNTENKNVKDVIQVDQELLDKIEELFDEKKDQDILSVFSTLHHADTAEIINHLNLEQAVYCFQLLDTEEAGDVLVELDENFREKILKQIDTETLTDIIDELETDDATDIVSDLAEDVKEQVLENIDPEDSDEVKELLKYEEDTAGGLMSSDFVFVDDTAKVGDAIEQVRLNADEFEHIYQIYVLKNGVKLIGFVQLKSLLINHYATKITSIMEEELLYVTPDVDQEEVANIMEKYDLVAIPVVDRYKNMIGRITIDDIVDVIQEEASEDMQKIAGLSEEQETSDSIFRISRIRLPWLVIALFMEVVAAFVLQSYENIIRELVFATFFIPIVMAMGGSTGTQAAIVMVRGLSSGDIWLTESLKKLSKEFAVAALNGIALSTLLFGATFMFDGIPLNFAVIISCSLFSIILIATMVGATIPLMLKKFGADPAIATGPFVTTTNDILGLIIYLTFIILFFIN